MENLAEQVIELNNLLIILGEVKDDPTVPRNVRTKIEFTISTLKEEVELSIKVNKTLNELDEISNDVNLQPYTRTQIWNAISLLEKL
ncbi:UPF0147 family protein [Candidatus Woesearchaeota archaeon]|nr:UPF0147 family protein [Candidatus Woesearchaeota archaeon]